MDRGKRRCWRGRGKELWGIAEGVEGILREGERVGIEGKGCVGWLVGGNYLEIMGCCPLRRVKGGKAFTLREGVGMKVKREISCRCSIPYSVRG